MKTLEQITELVEMASTMIEPVRIQLNNAEWKLLAEHMARMRDLAACCYAGLGAECDLPEHWLDALRAAAEGKPFSTSRLLPYTSSLQPVVADALAADKAAQRLELMKHTPITMDDICRLKGISLSDVRHIGADDLVASLAKAARKLADAMIEEAGK